MVASFLLYRFREIIRIQKANIVCRILYKQAFFRNTYRCVRKNGYTRFRLHFEIIVEAQGSFCQIAQLRHSSCHQPVLKDSGQQ